MSPVRLLAPVLAALLAAGNAGAQPAVPDRPQRERATPRPQPPRPQAARLPAQRPPAQRPPVQRPAAPVPVPVTTSAPAPTMADTPPAAPALLPLAGPPEPPITLDPPPAPFVPLAPPPPPAIPPPIAVPARPAPPAPPVEIAADAAGAVTRIGEGLRLTFAPAGAALNPATAQALRELAAALPAGASVTIAAFAPGTPEDPSSSRRLSLARALAARAALLAEGIASPRIFVRALGASPAIAEGPPDRVDLTIAAPTTQAPAAPSRPAP